MRDAYIELRKNVFEDIINGRPPRIPMDFFYSYYVSQFEKQPKSRMFPKKDSLGGVLIDDEGNIIFGEVETQQIDPFNFSKQFSLLLMADFEGVMIILDKVFNISWLEDKDGNRIKLIE